MLRHFRLWSRIAFLIQTYYNQNWHSNLRPFGLTIVAGILGQNLKNQSRRSKSKWTSLGPKWPAKSIYAIARAT